MPSLFFICPKTRQQADTGILTDLESLRDTWSMTLNVNCPHCGEMHAVSVRETYIDDAIRNVSEIARRVSPPLAAPARDRLPVRHRQPVPRQCPALAEAHKRSLIRREPQGKIVANMIKLVAAGAPREKDMEKAFKAGAYWWQIGEHFGMSQQTAYETVKRAKKKRARK